MRLLSVYRNNFFEEGYWMTFRISIFIEASQNNKEAIKIKKPPAHIQKVLI